MRGSGRTLSMQTQLKKNTAGGGCEYLDKKRSIRCEKINFHNKILGGAL